MAPARQVPWRMKHRPHTFDEFVDQDEIKGVLQRALESNQLDNWLFVGAPGLGKTVMARLFISEYAKRWGLVNAAGGPDEAFFKIVELTTDTANVQTVSDLASFAKFLLSREAEEKGAYRIIVLDEIDRFSTKAMEDLRSLLEGQGRWAGRAVVIATTNYPDKLPEAVRSRFRTFVFHQPPVEAMARRLKDVAAAEGCTVSDADVMNIAQQAEGSLRQGLVLLQEKCMGSLPPGEIPGGDLRSPVEEQERADAALLAMLEFPVRVPNEEELEAVLALIRRRSGVKEAKTYTYRGSRYDPDRFKAFLAGMAGRRSNVARVVQETSAKPPEAPAGRLSFFGAGEAVPPARPAPIGERVPPTLKAQGVLPSRAKRVGISGARARDDADTRRDVEEFIRGLPEGTIIVTGGSAGPDTFAEQAARRRGLEVTVHPVAATPVPHNQLIVDDSDEIHAWTSAARVGGGTEDTIERARLKGIPVHIHAAPQKPMDLRLPGAPPVPGPLVAPHVTFLGLNSADFKTGPPVNVDGHFRIEGGRIALDLFDSTEDDPDKAHAESESFPDTAAGRAELDKFLAERGVGSLQLPPWMPPVPAPPAAPRKEPWEMTQEEIDALPDTKGLYERLVERGHTLTLRRFTRTAERIEMYRGARLPVQVAFEDALREIAARVGITREQAATVLALVPEVGGVGGFVHGSAVPGVIHTLLVARAEAAGEFIPQEVLADYPGVKSGAAPPTTPALTAPPGERPPARFHPGDFVLHGARILHVKTVSWNGSDWEYVGGLNGTPDYRITQRDLVAGLPGPPAQPREAAAAAAAPPPAPEEAAEAPEDAPEAPEVGEAPPSLESLALPPDVEALPRAVRDSLVRDGYRLEDITAVVPGADSYEPTILLLRDRWGGSANVQVAPDGRILAAFEVGREIPYHKRGHEPQPTPARAALRLPPLKPSQEESIRAVLSRPGGLIVAPTGTGKTLMGLAIWERLGRPNMLWIEPTRVLLEEMVRKRFPQAGVEPSALGVWYGDEKRRGPVTFSIYDTLALDPSFIRGWPLIVVDESHHLQEAANLSRVLPALQEAARQGAVVVALTATPPVGIGAAQVLAAFPLAHEITTDVAVEEGLLLRPEVLWDPVDLTPSEQSAYREATQAVIKASHAIRGGAVVWARVSKGTDQRAGIARMGLKGLSDRVAIVSAAQEKLAKVVEIVKGLPGERVLVFSLRVDALEATCERLADAGLSCRTMTSKTRKEQRATLLEQWGKTFQVLGSIHVLEEGMNVPEARVAILMASTASRAEDEDVGAAPSGVPRRRIKLRQVVQRVGRILRPREGKVAQLFVLYAPGTIDDQMVEAVTRHFGVAPPPTHAVAPEEREAEEAEEEPAEEVPPPPERAPAGVMAAPGAPPSPPAPPAAPAEAFGDFVVVPAVEGDLFWVRDSLTGARAPVQPVDPTTATSLARTLADLRDHGYKTGARVLAGKVLEPTGQTAGGFKRFRLIEGPPPVVTPPPAPPTVLAPVTHGDFEVRRFGGKWRIWDAANEQWSGGVPPDVDGPPIRAPITPHTQEANSVALLLAEHRLDQAANNPLFSTFFEPSGKAVGGFMTYQRAGMGPTPPISAPAPQPVAPAARAEVVAALAPPPPPVAPGAPEAPSRPSPAPLVTPARPLAPTPQIGNYAVFQLGTTWMVQDLLTNRTAGFEASEEAARNQAVALAASREQNYQTDPGLRAMMVPTGESPGGHRAFRFGR